MTADDTPGETPKKRGNPQNLAPAWQPGQSGNPAGRPKGSRAKLAEDFCAALLKDFEANGENAIELMRLEKPGEYARMIASILPKDLDVNLAADMSPDMKKWLGIG